MTDYIDALLDFDRLGAFAVSPDGSLLIYVAGGKVLRTPLDGRGPTTTLCTKAGVMQCYWRPDGDQVLVSTDADGRENFQLFELDPISGTTRPINAAPDVRHELGPLRAVAAQPYSPDSTSLAYGSNERDPEVFDIVVRDVAGGASRIAYLADDRHYPMCWSPAGTDLLVMRQHQNTEHTLLVCDLAAGSVRTITPGVAKWLPAGWSADGTGVYLATDYGRDRLGVGYLDVATGDLHWIATSDRDIPALALSPDRRRLAWLINDDGYTRLHVADLVTGARGQIRSLPDGVAARELDLDYQAPRFATDNTLVLAVSTPTRPTELYAVDVEADTARRLTSLGGRVSSHQLVTPEQVHYHSANDLRVPALLYRPPNATADEPAPMVVLIHGGPEWEHYPEYFPEIQALIHDGIGVIAPNIRGSTGNGTYYQRLIYRDWGGGDVDDIAHALTYLDTLDWVDRDRVGICGESYGGFVTLSCLVRMPERWKVAVDTCGPADLVDMTAHGPPEWRRRRSGWIGDPEEPQDLACLRDRSPLTHADRIQTPLLVLHGDHDARVAPEQSHRLVARLRELQRPVKLHSFDGEGHDFANGTNRAHVAHALVNWIHRHLGAS